MAAKTTEKKRRIEETAAQSAADAFVISKAGKAGTRIIVRETVSATFVLIACILWFFSLEKIGASADAIPWYVTVAAIGALCARQVARKREDSLLFDWAPKVQKPPLSLLESWAIAYCAASFGLYLWICMQPKAVEMKPDKLVQFVDIQLVSHADVENRNSPLPGSVEADQLRKRLTDPVTQQGSLTSTKVSQIARHPSDSSKPSNEQEVKQGSKPETPHAPKPQVMPANQHPSVVSLPRPTKLEGTTAKIQKPDDQPLVVKQTKQGADSAKKLAAAKPAPQQPLIEEVQAPELVELIENDGVRDATKVFESGGKSAGGTGAANDLTAYIKGLHKRIKDAWSPPRGQSRRAEVLFRIKKEGKLSFIKVTASSGDGDTDAAAIRAVQAAVTGKALPADYPLPYLDVQYKFLYNADELKEIPNAQL